MNRHEFQVDGRTYIADGITWEYSVQESENSGRNDDGSMYHDVIGTITKVSYDFKDFRNEEQASALIKLLEKRDCTLTYYDLKTLSFQEKSMYVAGDAITAHLINDEFHTDAFQLRFTSNEVD